MLQYTIQLSDAESTHVKHMEAPSEINTKWKLTRQRIIFFE